MNSNIKIFLLCPVPEEQKPINEYIGLKESFITGWTTLSKKSYEKKIVNTFLMYFCITCCIQFSQFKGTYYILEWILENFWWTTLFFSLFFLVLLSRWVEIEKRFYEARLFYEEASWYDGQIWEKPLAVIKNDNLIRNQKIKPIVERIKKSLLQMLGLNFLSFLLLQLSFN